MVEGEAVTVMVLSLDLVDLVVEQEMNIMLLHGQVVAFIIKDIQEDHQLVLVRHGEVVLVVEVLAVLEHLEQVPSGAMVAQVYL